MSEEKPIGEVIHYYDKIGVAVVRFNRNLTAGTVAHFKGAHTDFTAVLDSMQIEHQAVQKVSKGEEAGVKVPQKVHEGDKVFSE